MINKNCTLIDNETGEIILDDYKLDINDLKDKLESNDSLDKRKSNDEFYRYLDEELGSFYFLFYSLIDNGIEPQYIFRFIYLCCYMDYKNRLLFGSAKEENRFMTEQDMEEVLKLGKREYQKTKKSLIEHKLIKINKDNTVSINKKHCIKGDIPKQKKNDKVRMFEKGIKEIYENSNPREHKKLNILIQILPYINMQYNIICKNPYVENREEIKPITLTELTELVGYKNTFRLKKDLFKLRVAGQQVVMIVETDEGKFITINPKAYYKGTRVEGMKWLVDAFSIKGGK